MYKNVIFDFYGTLVNVLTAEDGEYVWKKLSLYMAYQGASYESSELKASFEKIREKHLGRYSNKDYPEVDISDVFYRLYVDKGVKAKPKLVKNTALLYRTLTTEYLYTYEGVKPMLKELKQSGMRLYLLSNAQRVFLMAELKMLGLAEYFDGIYISSDYHTCKPDKTLFKALMDQEGLKKSETVMVGNEYSTDIKGANRIGIDSVYFLSETSDRKAKAEDATYSVLDGRHKKIIKLLV